jgi:DNA topoisomerase-1
MRTESVEYSDEFYANADKYVIKTYGIEYVPERNGLKQNLPHEAIRPTDILVETALDGKERRLYKLIRRNTIESVMRPATVSTLEVNVTAPENHAYKYVAENVVFRGWYVVSGRNVNKHAYGHLMHLSEGTPLSYKKITSQMSVVGIKPHYTEARLVQLLEQKGIGRPSTFASLVEKNIERGYIKKTNLPGKSTTCTDFELSDDGELVEHSTTKTFGVEKNKLAMEPLGAMVAEFLYDQFGLLFAYDYTEKMEDALDRIARGEHEWLEICTLCQETLHKLTGDVKPKKEEQFIIDDSHTYLIGKHGPVIKKTNSKTTFLSVKQNVVVDIDRLRAGTYSIDDLVEHENCVGMHEKKPILLKHGKFGDYIEWNGERVNVSKLTNISVETVVPLLNQTRMIDANTSVRKGKTGDYIYYKTPQMKKPQFIGLQKFAGDARTCSKTEICCFVNKMLK